MNPDDNKASNNSSTIPLANLLRQIIDVLEASSIAEERGKGPGSKFWAAYKKISGEYDDKMLERCNGNMDILMLFAGLFSAVNTAFIIAMQPNPADTTNDLLVELLQNAPWNAQRQVSLSAPVAFSSSQIWMQVLAYTSLTFSLLSAFGAVLGKQWLGYYKTSRFDRARGRLEDRCQQRHRKFQELEKMRFEYVLHSFPVLLQISLLLFILSLAAATWLQHRIISLFIMVPTACGVLFYVYIVTVSLIFPDSPFQTPVSFAIRYFLECLPKVRKGHGDKNPKDSTTTPALSWILDTSTNPDILSLALDLMVTISNQSQPLQNLSWIQKVPDMFKGLFSSATSDKRSQHRLSSLIPKVLDMFEECFNSALLDEDNAVSFGRAFIHFSWKVDEVVGILSKLSSEWKHWSSWRRLYVPRALEHCKTSFCRLKNAESVDQREQADKTTCTALRMALGAWMDKFVNLGKRDEYVELVWQGQFGSELNLPDVDWLMDCAKHFHTAEDFDAAGDALLLLSDVKNISQDSIVPFLNGSPEYSTLRHCALRAACRAVDINSPFSPSFVEAVLTAISPPIQRGHKGGDLFTNAIQLLELADWPQNHPLVGSSLIDIQRLIFLMLPAPSLSNILDFGRHCHALIEFMHRAANLDSKRAIDSKRAAVYVAYRIRRDLAMITGTPSLIVPVSLQTEVLSTLSPALLTMITVPSDPLDYLFYPRLIFTLASHPNWLPRLVEDGHIDRCIEIIPVFCDQPPSSFFYLAGIFLRIETSGGRTGLVKEPSQWWDLTRMAWHVAGRRDRNDGSDSDVLDDGIDILEALVTTTKSCMPPSASASDLEFLRNGLGGAILKLESRQPPPKDIIAQIKDLKRYEPPQIISDIKLSDA